MSTPKFAFSETNEKVFNNERANKFTDASLPISGSANSGEKFGCVHLSGTSPQVTPRLTPGMLYQLVSPAAVHILAGETAEGSGSFAATYRSYMYVPGDFPVFHIPLSASTDYVYVSDRDGGLVDCTFTIVERSDG